MTLDPCSVYNRHSYPKGLEDVLRETGVFFIKSNMKSDLREDDWYETVFSIGGKFFKSEWSVYEKAWENFGLYHGIISDTIREVFPVERTIIDYE